ncbi:DUF3237 family protein [Microbacterium karelineae]|uniref:DUF3237 family protein n=1 Tax=Microbacterium karelineae TaxID=2654283 RepID=UPI0012EA44D2|nr:DUF3237 family protein [Microbacterium karelineae]
MSTVADPPIPQLERAFEVDAELGPLEDHGRTGVGHRRIIPVVGGTITGEFEGELLAGGADWQVVRADGSIALDARYSARSADGELICITARGVRSGDPEVLEALLRGEDVDPSLYYFRTAIAIESSTRPELEHAIFVGSCIREANRVRYVAFRVT